MSKELADILLPSETWRNPLFPLEDRLAMCEGAVAYERTLRKKFEKERDEAIAALRSEPVELQFRHKETNEHTVNFGKFSPWETCSEAKYAEIKDYISQGYSYEVRELYAAPSRESQRLEAERIAGSQSNSNTQSSDHPTDRYETLGYALAMRIMQSGMYDRLDDKERAECDELIRIGMAAPSREDCKPKEQK